MLRYTHIYELIYRLVGLFVVVLSVGAVFELLKLPGFGNTNSGFPLVVTVIIYLSCCIGVVYLLNKSMGWLPTFLYIRLTLSTKVSPSEADKLSFLFNGSLNGKWYRLLEIKELKPESRKQALFQFASKVASERR